MHHDTTVLLTVALAVGLGVVAQLLAHRFRVPGIVLLLLFGVLAGSNIFDIIRPTELGDGLSVLIKLAVAVILFEGALNLRLRDLRTTIREVRNLITLGVVINWILTTLVTHYVAGFSWPLAILFGALMTVTGPTVVQPLLRRVSVPKRVKTILEGEAILVDPIGAILAVAVADIVLQFYTDQTTTLPLAIWGYIGRLAVGFIVGALGGLLLSRLMKAPRLVPTELGNLVALAAVWLVLGVAETLQSESGIMASVIMGLVVQREAVPGERRLRHFKEQLTVLSISVLFILLAANLNLNTLLAEGWRGVTTVVLMMLVIRPLVVFTSTRGSILNWREKAFIAWIGPRGIVAASVASLYALLLTSSGVDEGSRLLALTFLTIAITVTVQGLTAVWVVGLLGVRSMVGRKAIIVGATPLGTTLAGLLRDRGRPVVLIDRNPIFAREAREQQLDVVEGNALDDDTLERAGAEEAETIVGLTTNSEVNFLVTQLAADEFSVRRNYPVLDAPDKGAGPKLLDRIGGKLAFGRSINVQEWEYALHDGAQAVSWHVPPGWPLRPVSHLDLPAEALPLICVRGPSVEVVHAGQVWRPGDEVIVLSRLGKKETATSLDAASNGARARV